MERDILSPRRRVDIFLWMGWGRVFLEHLMAITGDLGMGICLRVCACDVKEGKKWRSRYDQDSTAGSCHSFDPQPL